MLNEGLAMWMRAVTVVLLASGCDTATYSCYSDRPSTMYQCTSMILYGMVRARFRLIHRMGGTHSSAPTAILIESHEIVNSIVNFSLFYGKVR